MNIYEKLQTVRVELQNKKLKKSGKNKFAGFSYFELKDFLPTVNELFMKNKLFSNFSMSQYAATLEIVDAETNDKIEFKSPIESLELKGCNKIQALGGVHTYIKRYLYINALEIVEADLFDSVTGSGELEEEADTDLLAGMDACTTLKELQAYYSAYYQKAKDKKAFVAKKNELKERLAA